MIYNRQAIHIAVLLWGCIFSLLTALCLYMSREQKEKTGKYILGMQISCAILMGSDAAAWAFRGSPGDSARRIVVISNFLVFFMSDVILLFYHRYVCSCLFEQARDRKTVRERLVEGICVLALLLIILSQFTHLYYEIDAGNVYHRKPAHVLSMLLPMTGGVLDFTLLIQYRKNIGREMRTALISYLVLPLAASVIQIFYYGISFSNIAICVSMILMFLETMIAQNRKRLEQESVLARQEKQLASQELELTRQEKQLAEQEQELARQEKQLTQRRIAAMMSQMRTHFIFNVLATISGYCKIDPEKADQALIQFSRYLRRNMRFLEEDGLIMFRTETAQLDDYVALQQMRFPNQIKYEKEFEEMNFWIPPLTIQPLVENAIKHGLIERARTGTVRVTSRKEENGVRIEVIDDGAGFDQKELEKEDSVGIRNVRYRLEKMMNASMEIASRPGEGTRVVIHIPEGRCGKTCEYDFDWTGI